MGTTVAFPSYSRRQNSSFGSLGKPGSRDGPENVLVLRELTRLAGISPGGVESAVTVNLQSRYAEFAERMPNVPMRSSLILCLWPGLAASWLRGSYSALAAAMAFGGLLNFVITATFVWPNLGGQELPAGLVPVTGWLLVLWLWVGGITQQQRMLLTWATPPQDDGSEKLFRQAQTEYLRGQWVAAERLLAELLNLRPADIEGRLLLATVLRRMKRTDDAARELTQLEELPSAGYWYREIADERRQLVETTATETTGDKKVKSDLLAETANAEPASRKAPPSTRSAAVEEDDEVQIIAHERVEQERNRRKAA